MRPRTPPVKAATGNGALLDEEREREREREREKERSSLGGHRKKGIGVRAWLMIDPTGRTQLVEAGKQAIMRRACLPARDLRILDPLLCYPSTILGRERAIVLNLEHIKAIITAQEVLLLNSKDPLVVPVVLDLQRRLPVRFNALGEQMAGDGGGNLSDEGEGNQKPNATSPAGGMSRVSSKASMYNLEAANADAQGPFPNVSTSALHSRAMDFRGAGASPSRISGPGGPSALPFEFRALEVCLEAACGCLDAETTMLEREAYPALDELTSKLSTLNLERVRQIKARLVAISGRVQKVRDEIEQLLDDDRDMAEMYLTDKLMQMQEEGSTSSASSRDHSNPMSPTHHEGSGRRLHGQSLQLQKLELLKNSTTDDDRYGRQSQFGLSKEISGGVDDSMNPFEGYKRTQKSTSSTSSSTTTAREKLDVEELEMLLEAYFVQIDGTINKLSALREYVDDTEDYINIMLDDKQNHLLQMGVMLTTATLVVSAFIVVTAIFGMNIEIELFDDQTNNTTAFSWVVGASFGGCILIYVSAIAWYKFKRLIE